MSTMTADRAVLTAMLAAGRAFTRSLEKALSEMHGATPAPADHDGEFGLAADDREVPLWNPLTDEPHQQPFVHGTRVQRDWTTVVYLGSVWMINVRQGRGADSVEVREFAMRAGYLDGRSVTAWSKGNGATRNDEAKTRWITDVGKAIALGAAARVGVRLPDELMTDLP